ncbi:lipase/acyltransferase domain-containing protein [Streptomyces sp. NPDC004126]|uniref:lipase/acyltransferase domain-containing protein n=1 Tax=Streptomyces sp. NPDC004126 TaxID=3390695 RepID=UPI003D02CA88
MRRGGPGGTADGGTGAAAPPWRTDPPPAPDVTHDAVVVVPGIMGSALWDTSGDRPVWGLKHPAAMLSLFTRADGLRPLHLDERELAGDYGRIRATGIVEVPVWAPFLKGLESLGALRRAVRASVADPAAVLEFAYDWRLPAEVNGALLAEAAHRHLDRWLADDAHDLARRLHPDGREARLVFVAHSMGGLVTRAAFEHAASQGSDLVPRTRTVLTLGTPFLGSLKAVQLLNGHRAYPVPDRLLQRMQALAATLPAVHDLLPAYRCVDAGQDVRGLDAGDVKRLGGDPGLASRTLGNHERLRRRRVPMGVHRAVVGTTQPTPQTIVLDNGVAHVRYTAFLPDRSGEVGRDVNGVPLRRDRRGDGTVYRDAAVPGPDVPAEYVPLTHGALAKDDHVLAHVRAVLTEHELGALQGDGDRAFGLELPDSAVAGSKLELNLLPAPDTVIDSLNGITCSVHEAASGRRVARPRLRRRDGVVGASVTLPAPGLYRVRVKADGRGPLTQLVLALPRDPVAADGGAGR